MWEKVKAILLICVCSSLVTFTMIAHFRHEHQFTRDLDHSQKLRRSFGEVTSRNEAVSVKTIPDTHPRETTREWSVDAKLGPSFSGRDFKTDGNGSIPFYLEFEEERCHSGLHLIFSTVCNAYGDWQSEGLIYSHFVTRQFGSITRISSCNTPGYEYPKAWHPCFAHHRTQDKSGQVSTFNKAFAIRDWFENGGGKTLLDEDVVVMMDADMILTRALDSPSLPDAESIRRVRPGYPLSQQYMLGSHWIVKEKPIMEAVGCGARCDNMTHKVAQDHFQIGAPHFMAAVDWKKTAVRWTDYALGFWEQYKPKFPWEGDMFSLNMALMELGLFHNQTQLLMLSNPNSGNRVEGWQAISGLGTEYPTQEYHAPAPAPVPKDFVPANTGTVPILHYCQFLCMAVNGNEHVAGYTFGKYDYFRDDSIFIKKGHGLMKCPPLHAEIASLAPNIDEEVWRAFENEGRPWQEERHLREGQPGPSTPKLGGMRNSIPGGLFDRRRLFMMREITSILNAAFNNYRVRACGGTDDVFSNLVSKPKTIAPEVKPVTSAHKQQELEEEIRKLELKAKQKGLEINNLEREFSAQNQEHRPQNRMKVAVAITVADDGPQGDGAAVLARCVRNIYPASHPRYDLTLLAIVSPTVQKMRPLLEAQGYTLLARPPPLSPEDLPLGSHFRDSAPKSGCCGLTELLKLEGWTLMEYSKVLLLDMDTYLAGEIDFLWDSPYPMMHTTTGGKMKEALQGGMVMLRPSNEVYKGILDVVRTGDFHYNGKGWRGSGVGYYYGGETFQGVVPYYFQKVMAPGSYLEVDACIWNNMGDSPRCLNIDPTSVKIFHFTVCQKPWYCIRGGPDTSCRWAQDQWWRKRNELEVELGLPKSDICAGKHNYIPISFPNQDESLYARVRHGCENVPKGCAK